MAGCAVPLIAGFTAASIFLLGLSIGIGGSFAGEAIYQVWSQEFFPTLLRGTAQGITQGINRGLTAGFAVLTPSIAIAAPHMLVGFVAASGLIGALVIPALERSRGTAPWVRASAAKDGDTAVATPTTPT